MRAKIVNITEQPAKFTYPNLRQKDNPWILRPYKGYTPQSKEFDLKFTSPTHNWPMPLVEVDFSNVMQEGEYILPILPFTDDLPPEDLENGTDIVYEVAIYVHTETEAMAMWEKLKDIWAGTYEEFRALFYADYPDEFLERDVKSLSELAMDYYDFRRPIEDYCKANGHSIFVRLPFELEAEAGILIIHSVRLSLSNNYEHAKFAYYKIYVRAKTNFNNRFQYCFIIHEDYSSKTYEFK